MALPPLNGGPWLDLLIRDPLTYARHVLRGNRADDGDFAKASPDRPPVLLIHGFMGTRGALFVLEQRLRADGFQVFSISLGTLNIQDIRKSAFGIHLAVQKIMEATHGKVSKIDIIGHSMGGLIALYYTRFMGGDEHVRKLVSLGTPYRGTWASLAGVACFGTFAPSVWQMLPGSSFLRQLGELPAPPSVEWTSVIARYDGLCPPATAKIAPGTNYELPLGHAGLVLSADVYRVVKRVLRREHEPTTRTVTFSMVDGKWTRVGDRAKPNGNTASHDRRRDERRRAERREDRQHDRAAAGRVNSPARLHKAARTARARKKR
jgi:pimeloyl-ACP methyl ester carboxylesterase